MLSVCCNLTFHILIFICKTAQLKGSKLEMINAREGVIQIYTNKVDPPWEGAIMTSEMG